MGKPILIGVVIIGLGLFCELGCKRSEMTNAQVAEMFEKAGGVDKVNQEAKIIFDRFGTNESKEIFGSDLTNFPAMSSLGKPFFLQNNISNWSACIEIPFGTHYRRNFIFIFNSGSSIEFPYASRCLQVATNIFVGK
jgi:hypothetical protein